MSVKVKTSKIRTINTLLKRSASCIDNKYYFFPFWFEKDSDGHFIMHHLENLPNNLKESLMSERFSKKKRRLF